MKNNTLIGIIVIFFSVVLSVNSCNSPNEPGFTPVIAMHGGAGTITRDNMTRDKERDIRTAIDLALKSGFEIMENGGSSIDAVVAAVTVLEDSPHFNAGKGAVFASNGKNELDASIMDGKTLNAGAVSGTKHIKNPIKLARLVMDSSRHVFFYGDGAENFARNHDLEFVPEDYFFTQERWDSFLKAKNREAEKMGTVGVVALDKSGNLAAGTSTGGLTNKKFGRIGDSPVIGAGTYADNRTCAVSATGTGEYFIRTSAASSVSKLMHLAGKSLQEALDQVIHKDISTLGGSGGFVGIDSRGRVGFSFNTEGMYRGYLYQDEDPVVLFYKD